MIAVTVTLILMSLVVQIFQFVSNGVFAARANMELSDQLRNAKHRLILDLRGTTALTVPPAKSGAGGGYFEYAEGPVVSGEGPDLGFRPGGTFGGTATAPQFYTEYGDRDDMLMFTTMSLDQPFVGSRTTALGGSSRFAEVAWFTRVVQEYANANERYLTLRRRFWMVNRAYAGANPTTVDVSAYQQGGAGSPVAAPPVGGITTTLGQRSQGQLVGNTMESLIERENRMFHNARIPPFTLISDTRGVITPTAPFQFTSWTLPISAETYSLPFETTGSGGSNTPQTPGGGAFGEAREENQAAANSRVNREHADIILNNVIAFDVKAWDPGAPVFRVTGDSGVVGVVLPGDAGYLAALGRFITSPGTGDNAPVAFGAYADLNYFGYRCIITGTPTVTGTNSPVNKYNEALDTYRSSLATSSPYANRFPRPQFAGPGNPLSRLMPLLTNTGTAPNNFLSWTRYATYCTWSDAYESDGLDSNIQTNTNYYPYIRDNGSTRFQTIDEGTNGFDDVCELGVGVTETATNPARNGLVDEVIERDAPPPYEVPLRGLKITIRVMEPDSKQVREATVVHEFLPL